MADNVDPKHLDKRTADRYLRGGQLNEKAYESHIKGLPDVADKAVPVETRMDEDLDMYDDEDEDELDDDESDDEGSDDAEDTAAE
ncbi:hypothetical protein JGU66_14400 [Myxococcaceae bacterium JPH2]|nr:hypothetical protein [Myxococcaceae bacterium JPH2]